MRAGQVTCKVVAVLAAGGNRAIVIADLVAATPGDAVYVERAYAALQDPTPEVLAQLAAGVAPAVSAAVISSSIGTSAVDTLTTVVPPSQPLGVAASFLPCALDAEVTWLAPADLGGATAATYTAICSSPAGSAATTVSGALRAVVKGLVAGQAYTCTVLATNAAGVGQASAPAPAITRWASRRRVYVRRHSAGRDPAMPAALLIMLAIALVGDTWAQADTGVPRTQATGSVCAALPSQSIASQPSHQRVWLG
jgi:hypothetical protein